MGSRAKAALAVPLFALAGCPGAGAGTGSGKGSNVEITDVAKSPDASVPVGGGDDRPPVEPGSAEDVIGRVFTLGSEPAIPAAFGKLRPWTTRADANKARPSDWGSEWSKSLANEPVTLGTGEPEDDPIPHLDVSFDQAGAAWRLEQAWGKPDLRSSDKSLSCWLAPSAKLKACHSNQLGHDVIELAAYMPLGDALGSSGGRQFSKMASRIGQSKAEIERAFPQHNTVVDEIDPTKNRVEIYFPSTEYMASAHPDRVLLYTDAKDKVHSVAIRFGANDPDLRAALVEQVRSMAEGLSGGSDAPNVTVLEGEPIDVVVVIDRDQKLH